MKFFLLDMFFVFGLHDFVFFNSCLLAIAKAFVEMQVVLFKECMDMIGF